MARFNEILVGRYNRSLQRLFGIKGEPPAPQLASEIQPTFNIFSGVELRALDSWSTFMVAIAVPAGGAGNFATVRLRNPGTSVRPTSVVAVIEKLSVKDAVGAAYRVGYQVNGGTDLAAPTIASLDPRTNTNGQTILSSGQATVALGTQIDLAQTNATVSQWDFIANPDQELILFPGLLGGAGNTYEVQCQTVNQAAVVIVRWRERTLEEGELF